MAQLPAERRERGADETLTEPSQLPFAAKKLKPARRPQCGVRPRGADETALTVDYVRSVSHTNVRPGPARRVEAPQCTAESGIQSRRPVLAASPNIAGSVPEPSYPIGSTSDVTRTAAVARA